jgi:16S rRNA (cytosine1402-N4)-methyltransferase
MDPTEGASAAAFLEKCSRDELVRAIRDLGEEKAWKRIVGAIWRARGTGRLGRTASLASLIADAAGPAWQRKSKLHPATLSFQGIRMAVNAELEAIEAAVPVAFAKLADEARLVAISFHSLEDRLVKRLFREFAGRPVDRFDNRFQQDRSAQAELLTNRPIQPTPEEIAENPRSRSSRLRALRKLPVS